MLTWEPARGGSGSPSAALVSVPSIWLRQSRAGGSGARSSLVARHKSQLAPGKTPSLLFSSLPAVQEPQPSLLEPSNAARYWKQAAPRWGTEKERLLTLPAQHALRSGACAREDASRTGSSGFLQPRHPKTPPQLPPAPSGLEEGLERPLHHPATV